MTFDDQTQTTYNVAGMTCGHCEFSVREEVEALPGVSSARIDRATGILVVRGQADEDAVAAAVAEAGYEVVASPPAPKRRGCTCAPRALSVATV